MNDKIIWQVFDAVRASAPYSESDSLVFALQLLAWTKLSFSNSIESDIQVQNMRSTDTKELKSILEKLSLKDGIIGQAFAGLKITPNSEFIGLRQIIDLCIKLGEAGMLENLDPTDAVSLTTSRHSGDPSIPKEIADLMMGLISSHSNMTVYTPWDFGAQLAGRALKSEASVYLETQIHSALPALVGVLLGGNLTVVYTDPIVAPLAIDNAKLRKFDTSVALPPFGLRYDLETVDRDWFGRFPERTNSGIVLTIRHLLAQTKTRIVIAAPNTLLSSPGYEKTLREDLIQKGIVESVISLPSGLFSFSNVAMSILVLDPRGGHQKIRFVNGDNKRFREPISKARARLINVDKLLNITYGKSPDDDASLVSINSVIENDAQLLVSRYLLADSSKRIQTILSSQKTVPLGDLVSTVRPMPTVQESQQYIEALEVGAADLPKFGYIRTTGRAVKIDADIAQKNKHQFLKPLDIILIVKGSVGKIGIVPMNVPEHGSGSWVAGQSATILRVDDQSKINPRTLSLYLRSELGQELLKTIISGATIQLIQLRELLRLPIAVPSLEDQSTIASALDEEAAIQDEIDLQIKKQAKVAANFWNLD
ncbi:MAG: N-6 DNA methylase [Methylotenera sp.]